MDLTVAICTYQRREMLRLTLASLAAAARPALAWELLVVDNAGEPAVEELVRGFADRLPLRYLAEPALGASHARNCAVRAAAAPIVLFTDDDVTFAPDWLGRMSAAISAHPECAFWGGRVEPVWPGDQPAPPVWFDAQRCPMLGDTIVQYRRGDSPRYWDGAVDPPFYTANLALRVSAVADAGYFNTQVGHRGKVRMGMEDSLMVRAIAGAGGRGWYAADAVVHHPVPVERLTRAYARSFAWRQGWMSVMTRRNEQGRLPRWFYRAAIEQGTAGLWDWLAGSLTGRPGRAFAGQFQWVFNGSRLWHALGKSRP